MSRHGIVTEKVSLLRALFAGMKARLSRSTQIDTLINGVYVVSQVRVNTHGPEYTYPFNTQEYLSKCHYETDRTNMCHTNHDILNCAKKKPKGSYLQVTYYKDEICPFQESDDAVVPSNIHVECYHQDRDGHSSVSSNDRRYEGLCSTCFWRAYHEALFDSTRWRVLKIPGVEFYVMKDEWDKQRQLVLHVVLQFTMKIANELAMVLYTSEDPTKREHG